MRGLEPPFCKTCNASLTLKQHCNNLQTIL
ncbi:unnamed protein product [Nezara viridula]|uniref:Uncharacterized protein n=1 Tax=Nezara viridula TaxID=85310 RepID=A0A9P0HSG5_NEZVI|nr:unnamed protein product [Nezara viridula]